LALLADVMKLPVANRAWRRVLVARPQPLQGQNAKAPGSKADNGDNPGTHSAPQRVRMEARRVGSVVEASAPYSKFLTPTGLLMEADLPPKQLR
jgi:hypothetical protein